MFANDQERKKSLIRTRHFIVYVSTNFECLLKSPDTKTTTTAILEGDVKIEESVVSLWRSHALQVNWRGRNTVH